MAAFMQAVLGVLVLCAILLATPAQAKTTLLALDSDAHRVVMDPALEYFLDTSGLLGLDAIASRSDLHFSPLDRRKPQQIEGGALWLRFEAEVQNPQLHWKLILPLPGIDLVTLYFRDAQGQWVQQQAGDSLRMSRWPQPGRYPVFSLSHEVGKPVRYYLQIHQARVPFSAMPRVVSEAQLTTQHQTDHLLLGIYFGLAALVTLLALANAVASRDWGFASFAAYMALYAGTQGAFTGLAGLYGWPEWPELNNAGVFLLPMATAAAAMWFVRIVSPPRRFSRALDWFVLALMGLLLAVGVIDAVSPSPESFTTINALAGASLVMLLVVVGVALVEGDRHARWIALGLLPVLLATLFPLLRNLGAISSGFLTEYSLMLGSAVGAPIHFYGLHRRTSQRREPTTRAAALRTTDPLTGLSSPKALFAKLRQALGMAERYQQPFALLVINLTNLAKLQSEHGRETGDRAMVMAAARIRAVARPADTVARVDDSQFALLIEGPISALSANDVATKILASGLRPSHELPDDEPLLFHIAVGHLADPARAAATEAAECLARMVQAIKDMNDGSRKAIRLVSL